jgi:two-component system, chemotaxis family, response regulator Rcp1
LKSKRKCQPSFYVEETTDLLPNFDILLIDDSAADARIFQEALRQASTRARAYWVATGEEAIDFLAQQGRFVDVRPVRLVVLDINMPGQDGMETLRRIKSSPMLNRVPVVLFSSSRDREEIDLAYSLGANAYFSKPISLEHYIDKVRILVQHWLDLAELPSPIRARTGIHPAALSMEDELTS